MGVMYQRTHRRRKHRQRKRRAAVLATFTLSFGRYRNRPLAMIPIDYLRWMLTVRKIPAADRWAVERYLQAVPGPSQASMVAARARDYYDRQAKERQKRKPADSVQENLPEQKGKARDQAAKAVGVSGKTVDFATKVLKHGTPELVKAVDAGSVAVSKAATIAKLPKEKQVRVLAGEKTEKIPWA